MCCHEVPALPGKKRKKEERKERKKEARKVGGGSKEAIYSWGPGSRDSDAVTGQRSLMAVMTAVLQGCAERAMCSPPALLNSKPLVSPSQTEDELPPAPPPPLREAGDAGQVCGRAPPEWVGAWARVWRRPQDGGVGLRVSLRPVGATSPRPGGGAESVPGLALVRLAAEPRWDALGAAQVRRYLVPGCCAFPGSCRRIMLFRDGQRYSLRWKCKEIWALRKILLFGEKWRDWLKTDDIIRFPYTLKFVVMKNRLVK